MNQLNGYKIAELEDGSTQMLQEFESKLNQTIGKDIILIAYQKETKAES